LDLEPYYGLAEEALGVAGADDPWASPRSTPFPLPAFPFSYSDGLFAPACRALGIALHSLPQARNSAAYRGRPPCQACSTCHVCPTGAKASIDLTHVPEAEATGKARILTDATVLRLEVDRAGEVRAAVYARPDKVEERLSARVFVVAAGAIETARLLLLSTSREFPDGLANRSGLVGRFFMSHPSVDVTGRAQERVYPYRIGFSTAMSRQFVAEGDRAARGAFLLEFLNSAGPTPDRIAAASGLWGDALRQRVREEFGRWVGIRIYCEQLPDPANSVSLNARVRDYFGIPVPHLQYDVGRYEEHALDEAKIVAVRILQTLGVTDIRPSGLGFAAHQIGTHRMGADPATSVVDPNLRAHDVPNLYLVGSGCFVTASASPPTLTIAALAIRAAEHIAARLRR
jgi:choline dehydrogenase-like flavoprotein